MGNNVTEKDNDLLSKTNTKFTLGAAGMEVVAAGLGEAEMGEGGCELERNQQFRYPRKDDLK